MIWASIIIAIAEYIFRYSIVCLSEKENSSSANSEIPKFINKISIEIQNSRRGSPKKILYQMPSDQIFNLNQ